MAFTGFAGVVSVFGKSSLEARVQFWRIRTMIVAGLLTIFGAFVPIAISHFQLSLEASWQLAAGILSSAVIVQFFYAARGASLLRKEKLIGPVLGFEWFLAAVSTVTAVTLILCSLGFLSESLQAIYFVGLLYLLSLSAHHFFNLIIAALPKN